MTTTVVVSASVVTDCPVQAMKASEMLNRVCIGLALDGITARMDMASFDEEVDCEEDSSSKGTDEEECDPPSEA